MPRPGPTASRPPGPTSLACAFTLGNGPERRPVEVAFGFLGDALDAVFPDLVEEDARDVGVVGRGVLLDFQAVRDGGDGRLQDDHCSVGHDHREHGRAAVQRRRGVEQDDVGVGGQRRDHLTQACRVGVAEAVEARATRDDRHPEAVVGRRLDGRRLREHVVQRRLRVREPGVEEEVRHPGVGVDHGDVVAFGKRHPQRDRTGGLSGSALSAGDSEHFDHYR